MNDQSKSQGDPLIDALQTLYKTLAPLDVEQQDRVLTSLYALLGKQVPKTVSSGEVGSQFKQPGERPKSIAEFVASKKPGTNTQRIAVFAYFHEQTEGKQKFQREDLRPYFVNARLGDPGNNFGRDFDNAVGKGWIAAKDGSFYLTQTGINVVEAGFNNENSRTSRTKTTKKSKLKAKNRTEE